MVLRQEDHKNPRSSESSRTRTRITSGMDAKDSYGVSLFGATEQWVPPEQELERRPEPPYLDDDAFKPAESIKLAEPTTPRRPSQKYPQEIRAALKSLRRSLFLALKKKAQLGGVDYMRTLLLNAESYKAPEPRNAESYKAPEPRKSQPEEKEKLQNEETVASEEIPEIPQSYEMRYEDDGVKPHTRTLRGSTESKTRMVAVSPVSSRPPTNLPVSSRPPTNLPSEKNDSTKEPPGTPPEWTTQKSASTGRTYYYSKETGESTWTHPTKPEQDDLKRVNALAIVDALQRDLGVHVFKKEFRALLSFDGIGDGETLAVETLLEALSEQVWWPTGEQISNSTAGEIKKMRMELDLMVGPKLAGVLTDGQDLNFVKKLLEEAQSDRTAVEELKAFLEQVQMMAMTQELASIARSLEPSLTERERSKSVMMTKAEFGASPKRNNGSIALNMQLSPLRTESAKVLADKFKSNTTLAKKDGNEFPEYLKINDDDQPVQLNADEIKDDVPEEDIPGESPAMQSLTLSISEETFKSTVKSKKSKTGISPFLSKITRPLVKELSILPPTVKKTFPVDIPPSNHIRAMHISKSGSPNSIQISKRDPDFEWTPWVNPKTGKLHEPIRVPTKSRGSSRQRSREFSKLAMDAAVEDRRKNQEDHNAFWKRGPSPAGPRVTAIEYRRWHYLDETVPGWTAPSRISSTGPKTPWYEQKIEIPHKMGSRYTCRVGDSQSYRPEPITATTQLVGELKEERGRANLVLRGQIALKSVRTLVVQSSYDRAVKTAEEALHKFKESGKHGAAFAKEINNSVDYVIALIKSDIDKQIELAKDAVQRSLCDKASQQIPKLRKACTWLMAKGVVHPEARELTHWEARNGISQDSFPQGMAVIDALMQDIIKKAAEGSRSLISTSLNKFFSSMRPELNMEDETILHLIKEAEQRPNALPGELVTDGRTFIGVFDLKPPNLPEKLKINQKIDVRGERILASGVEADPSEWMTGTITSWNQRTSKYRVQYHEDYEWIMWPADKNPAVEIEINTYPEDVVVTVSGFNVRSITQEYPERGRKAAIVAFTLSPVAADLSSYGLLDISVKGMKSEKSLFEDDTESVKVLVLPSELLRPATSYQVYDSVTNQLLPSAIVEFVRSKDEEKFVFSAGQTINLEDGVYEMEIRGNDTSGYPWTALHTTCVLVQGRFRASDNQSSCVFLNRHIRSPNELRIVMTWGAKPLELDAHIYTSEGGHIKYTDAGEMTDAIKFEMDSVRGYGPETVMIKVSSQLAYSFSVFWPGEGGSSEDWTAALATVTLYDAAGPIAVFHTPAPSQGATDNKWWHVFAFDGSMWTSPGHGIHRVNQLSSHEKPQLALPGWTLIDAASKGLWDDFCSQLAQSVQGGGGGSVVQDQASLMATRVALMTSLEGCTLLSLLCAHNYDPATDITDELSAQESIKGEKQMAALHALLKSTVQLEQRAKSQAARDGGIPHDLALAKEICMRGVRDTYIYRAVLYASQDVAVHLLNVLVPVVQRSSMTSSIRQFFYENAEDLLDMCVIKRPPQYLLPILQAILAIEAVWERKPIRRFLEKDRVLVEWPQGSGNLCQGIVHKCRYDANVIRLDTDPNLSHLHTACQSEPSDEGVLHDSLLADNLIMVVPSRLKWTSPVLLRLKGLAEKYQNQKRIVKSQQNEALTRTITSAQRQILLAADVYKKAVKIMSQKAFIEEEKDKKKSLPTVGDNEDE